MRGDWGSGVFVELTDYANAVSVFIWRENADGVREMWAPWQPVLRRVDDTIPQEPSLRLTIRAGQQLMDAMWKAGLRPSGKVQTEDERKATQAHLDDMRKLVWHALKIKP